MTLAPTSLSYYLLEYEVEIKPLCTWTSIIYRNLNYEEISSISAS